MKKTYFKPESTISNVQPVTVIAASVGMSNDPADALYPGGGDAPELHDWFDL